MAQETANMFAKQHILNVMLEEHCICPMETELETKHPLLESEPFLPEIQPSQLEPNPPPLHTEPSPLKREPLPIESEMAAPKRKVCYTGAPK